MIVELLKQGFEVLQDDTDKKEQERLGVLRGGSVGCYVKETGKVYGVCPRKALLRYKGFQKRTDYNTYLNFVAGFGHEVNILNLLEANPKVVKIEVWDAPRYYSIASPKMVLHDTSLEGDIDGVKWTGRPDIVVTLDTGKKYLIEDKATISEDKAENSSKYPFLYAICQAYKYRMAMGNIDTYLLYGSYANYGEFKFGINAFPKSKRFPNIEYRDFPKGTYKKIPCAVHEYSVVGLEDGYIWISNAAGEATKTPLTCAGIDDYYKMIIECSIGDTLPPRPEDIELYGKCKYSPCKYCEYSALCDSYDKELISYNAFLTESRKI